MSYLNLLVLFVCLASYIAPPLHSYLKRRAYNKSLGLKVLELPQTLQVGWLVSLTARKWRRAHDHLLSKDGWHLGNEFTSRTFEEALLSRNCMFFSYLLKGEVVGIASFHVVGSNHQTAELTMLHMGSRERTLTRDDLSLFLWKTILRFRCDVGVSLGSEIPDSVFHERNFIPAQDGWVWIPSFGRIPRLNAN